MKKTKNESGFQFIEAERYDNNNKGVLIGQSSAIDFDSKTGIDIPGSSYLWMGDFHLNKTEVIKLIKYMQNWVDKGKF